MSDPSLSARIILYGSVTLAIIFIWILDWIYGQKNNPVLNSVRLRLDSLRKVPRVVVLPVVIISAFNLFWWSFVGSLSSLNSVQIKIIIYTVLLAPIFEEFVLRGGLIGVVKKHFNLSNYYLPLLVLFSSVFFVIGHLDQSTTPVYFFIASVIYSALYIYNDYNLLAPIVAHATSNLIILGWRLLI